MESAAKNPRLLVIEDQKLTLKSLRKGLQGQGFDVDTAGDGEKGLSMALKGDYQLLLLDLGLPKMDGLTLLKALRQAGRRVPVLALTARDGVNDKVAGLDAGADDYLVKPFAFAELCARLRSLLRRSDPPTLQGWVIGELEMDPTDSVARLSGRALDLTRREFSLLSLLAHRQGSPVSRAEMMKRVWSLNIDTDTNIVDVAISRLRDKLQIPGRPPLLVSVRGVGYMLKAPEA